MPIKGPIIPNFSNVAGQVPNIVPDRETLAPNGMEGDYEYPAVFNELLANGKDGRLWLRKSEPSSADIDATDRAILYRYNYEQIGGPYVIIRKTDNHRLTERDSGRILEFDIPTNKILTVPAYTGPNSVQFVIGTEIKLVLTNEDTVRLNIEGDPEVTINTALDSTNLTIPWQMYSLVKRDTNKWILWGSMIFI